jgi:hypothetical protein
MSRQSIPCDQYPAPGAWGVKIPWIGDHFGPSNYSANGYNISYTSLGFYGGIEWAEVSALAQSGNYYAKILYPANSGNNENRAVTFQNVTIEWFFAANNVQVPAATDLSAECVRLLAIGI